MRSRADLNDGREAGDHRRDDGAWHEREPCGTPAWDRVEPVIRLASAGERIASNVLADRLMCLEAHGIVEHRENARDRRSHIYRLAERGIRLAPFLLEMILWAARHEQSATRRTKCAAWQSSAKPISWKFARRGRWGEMRISRFLNNCRQPEYQQKADCYRIARATEKAARSCYGIGLQHPS